MWGWVRFVGVGEEKSRLHMSGSQQAEGAAGIEGRGVPGAGLGSPCLSQSHQTQSLSLEKSPSSFLLQNTNGLSKQGDHTQSGKIYEAVFLNHNLFYLRSCENIVDGSVGRQSTVGTGAAAAPSRAGWHTAIAGLHLG